ncbi:MAG: AMP-dependent synthetase/ligase [Bacteroidales bacterium]
MIRHDGYRSSAELRLSDVLVPEHTLATLADLPFVLLTRFPDKPLMKRAVGRAEVSFTGREIFEEVRRLSLGLVHLGVEAGDSVAIIAESRPEWVITDLAAQCAGAITVPVYPTQSAAQVEFILRDSRAKVVVVSGAAQVEKLRRIRPSLPEVEFVLAFDAPAAGERHFPDALPLAEVVAQGRALLEMDPERGQHFQYGVLARHEQDTATVVYTTDESGALKGAVLTHANLLANLSATEEVLPLRSDDVALSLLPLSHVFERMALYRYLHGGLSVVFVESLMTVMRDLRHVRPTVMTGVPRVYEKFLSAVEDELARASKLRSTIVSRALAIGHARANRLAAGRRLGLMFRLVHALADRLVLSRLREGTGGRLRLLISGSAALPASVDRFFASIGLPIFEGYGLSETSPVLTTNAPGRNRPGTVGKPLPGVDIRLADDGEILARGPNVTGGYLHRDDINTEAFRGRWFHTGDIGHLDEDGYLTIIDRKKDLIVTAGGKKIAPSPLERTIMQSPLVADAILVGENRKFVSVLIVPNFRELRAELVAAGVPALSDEELMQRADALQLYHNIVDRLNASLAQFERIKRVALLPASVHLDRGRGPTTMLMRRRQIEKRWHATVDRLYAAGPRDRD